MSAENHLNVFSPKFPLGKADPMSLKFAFVVSEQTSPVALQLAVSWQHPTSRLLVRINQTLPITFSEALPDSLLFLQSLQVAPLVIEIGKVGLLGLPLRVVVLKISESLGEQDPPVGVAVEGGLS